MASSDDNQKLIATYAVLAGLTPLIPVPLVDDLALSYFKRQMVRSLSSAHGAGLDEDRVRVLIDEPSRGFLAGCVSSVLLYPIKKLFRKFFFFLEWKRAIDVAGQTYYQGFLINCALRENWCAPAGPRSAEEVRAGINEVLSRVNTSLIERAVAETFNQSKGLLRRAGRIVGRSTPRQNAVPNAEQAMADVAAQEEKQLGGVISQLQNAIAKMPEEHFQKLCEELAAALHA